MAETCPFGLTDCCESPIGCGAIVRVKAQVSAKIRRDTREMLRANGVPENQIEEFEKTARTRASSHRATSTLSSRDPS